VEFVRAETPAAAADLLREGSYTAVVADPTVVTDIADRYRRDELILTHVDEGIALLTPTGTVTWSNPVLRGWCAADPVGKHLLDALDRPIVASEQADPIAAAGAGHPVSFHAHRPASFDQPHLDVRLRPVKSKAGSVTHVIALARNITPEVEQKKKLDALHQAGRALADMDTDQLAELDLDTRKDLLRRNLRKSIHDLLQYDTIEVRLLDRRTGELKPLLEDGMTEEAAARVLFARPTGNGVTGYVAATGESYLCRDAATDPHYIRGAAGAASSMTVPLKHNDEVIGTLNVESPRPNAFGEDDLQFTELFSKEIAGALHQLDLLTAQQSCTASQSIEAVNKEIALPVDEILASAAVLYARLHGPDTDAGAHLRKVMAAARQIKDCVRKVGMEFTPSDQAGPVPAAPAPAADGPVDQTALVGKRVLVVDSDERLRRQAHLLLGRLGSAVETAGSAGEGLALAAGAPYDAVLLDLRPPDMGGYEAYRRFRAACPHAQVCLTTGFGYDVAHSIVKARQDGMQFVLFKPFRPDQVTKAVLTPLAVPAEH
jgi:CheY-like chemotaxis protein